MEERTIEVTVISASDLKNVKTFGGQQSSYVIAQLVKQRRSTKVDEKGHLYPKWNSKLNFTCDEAILEKGGCFITLEIFSSGLVNDTLIGTVTISVHHGDLFKKGTPADYAVQRPSGTAKGTLKVAVKLGEKRSITKYSGTQASYSHPQDYKKQQSYTPPASYGAMSSSSQFYPGAPPSYGQNPTQFYPGGFYEPAQQPNAAAISPYPSFNGGVYPPPKNDVPSTGYSTGSGTTGVKVLYPPRPSGSSTEPVMAYPATGVYPPRADASTTSSSSSEPVMAYPAVGYPVGSDYRQPQQQQYPPQATAGYPPQGYPSQPSYSAKPPQGYSSQHSYASKPPQGYPSYYAPQHQSSYQSKPPKRNSSGPGLGTGLLAGALGGLLLGDIFD